MTTIITFSISRWWTLKSEYIQEKMDIEKKKRKYKELPKKFDEFLKTNGNEILKVLRRLEKTRFIIH